MDICHVNGVLSLAQCNQEKEQLRSIVRMIAGLIRSAQQSEVHESTEEFERAAGNEDVEFYFEHERLEVYQYALQFVRWFESNVNEADVGVRRRRKLDALSNSIVLNIAEGNGRSKASDHRNFLDMAHRSALKAALQLDLVKAKSPESLDNVHEAKTLLRSIVRMVLAMADAFSTVSKGRRGGGRVGTRRETRSVVAGS